MVLPKTTMISIYTKARGNIQYMQKLETTFNS